MNRELIGFWAAILILVAIIAVYADPAPCASCSLSPCGSSDDCFSGCFCAKRPSEPIGTCYSE